MKKILFLVPYPKGVAPSQRLKFEQYFDYIEKDGFEITFKSFVNDKFWKVIHKKGFVFSKIFFSLNAYFKTLLILFSIRKYNIVYTHLWVTPFGFPFFEWMVSKLAKKLVYDIDDLVYTKNTTTSWYVNLIKGYTKPIFLMKNASHVITCTPFLDNFVKKYNPKTTDISSTVDTIKRYIPINKYTNEETLVIGWSGSHSTVRHFLTIKNVLIALQKKYPFIKVAVMGCSDLEIEGVKIVSNEWLEDIEIKTLQSFDIGLYPLPNEEWVFGKSGLKAIQYMALGIPTVATAIGTNYRVIDDGFSGFLVETVEEWIEKISILIENPDLRKKIGQQGRLKVEKDFSLHANAIRYLNVLNS